MRLPARILLLTALTAAPLAGGAAPSSAQSLKLASLQLFPSDVVGPWVTYKVRTQSGRTPPREFTQRVAIVGKEKVDGGMGYWVELKTIDRAGTRIERGLFAPSSEEDSLEVEEGLEPPFQVSSRDALGAVRPLKLARYQLLPPGGKLYEYPVGSVVNARSRGEVSSFELFEFDPSVRPIRSFLGPDTLRLGRRVVPSVLERVVRGGSDDWAMAGDSADYRLVLTQMVWRNAAVPITGFARSLLRVTTRRVAALVDSIGKPILAPPDTTLHVFSPADTTTGTTSMTPGEGRLLSWTELTLVDLGADAVAEVTQTPIPAPVAESETRPDTRIR